MNYLTDITSKEKWYPVTSQNMQPREKIIQKGVDVLSDPELFAVLLGSGVKGTSVHVIANQLQAMVDVHGADISMEQITNIVGLGNTKAMIILAALELGRRTYIPRKWQIKSPIEVLPLLIHYADRDQEHFISITLNGAHEVISKKVVSVGLLNRTLVHPREVFRGALIDHAASIIVAHNHPSGNISPSKEDIAVTKMLVDAGKILNIAILDHIIFSVDSHYSFFGEGVLTELE